MTTGMSAPPIAMVKVTPDKKQVWTSLDKFILNWTSLNQFKRAWTTLKNFSPGGSSLDKLDQGKKSLKKLKANLEKFRSKEILLKLSNVCLDWIRHYLILSASWLRLEIKRCMFWIQIKNVKIILIAWHKRWLAKKMLKSVQNWNSVLVLCIILSHRYIFSILFQLICILQANLS